MAEQPPIRPPWIRDEVSRDAMGQFVPGQSGNVAGRPVGSKNKRTVLSEQLEQAGSAVQAVVIAKALEGDMTAASLVMTRISPPLRARPPTVEFELDPDAEPADMSRSVLVAVAGGRLDPDTAKIILDMITAHCGLKDLETFAQELRRLESKRQDRIPGGVLIQ